jgi:hypothetical protein
MTSRFLCGQVQRDCFLIEEENMDYANPSAAKAPAVPRPQPSTPANGCIVRRDRCLHFLFL